MSVAAICLPRCRCGGKVLLLLEGRALVLRCESCGETKPPKQEKTAKDGEPKRLRLVH